MALVGGLIGGTGGNIGSASVALLLNTRQFDAALAGSQAKLTGAAAKMDAVGRKTAALGGALTRGVSVPLALAGAAATKMALDFNKAFVQIQTLGGKTGESIESLKAQVLDLAEKTGQDPGGLANALYVVSSAGKEAARNAMPILTQAAKGAALGMGDVETITKVLTATTNAYGAENLSAAQAMDIMSQAVTDSSAEADELAASLGPVIGMAAQVGISFEQVAAAMATATIQGVSTDRAATGLRFLMQSLAAPTQIAAQKLDQYGFSAQDLQRLIAKEGLQGGLQKLADTFDLTSTRGQQAWKAVVGGARGAIVANTLVGKHAAEAAAEVENLGDVAGVTNEKFELWGTTITGQNAKALGSLKAAAIRLGTELIPVFQDIVKTLSTIVDWFNDLSPAMRENVVKWGLIAAAVGPVLRIFGPFISLGGRVVGILTRIGSAATVASRGVQGVLPGMEALAGGGGAGAGAISGTAVAAAGLGAIFVALGAAAVVLAADTKRYNEEVGRQADTMRTNNDLLQETIRLQEEGMGQRIGPKTGAIDTQRTDALQAYRHEQEMVIQSTMELWQADRGFALTMVRNNSLTKEQTQLFATQVGHLNTLGGELDDTQEFQIKNALAMGNFKVALQVVNDEIRESHGELPKFNDSLKKVAGHGRAAAKGIGGMGKAYDGASKEQKKFLRDQKELDNALKESNREYGHGERAVRGMGRAANAASGDLRKVGDEADKSKGPVDDLRKSADEFGRGKYDAKLTAETSAARAGIGAAISLARDFATTWTARLVTDRSATEAAGGHVKGGQHGLESDVSRPTLFLAGEGGIREHVSIRPSGGGRRGESGVINVYINTAMGSDVGTIVEKALTERVLKRGALV